jgi:hypothetical protein
MYWDSNPPPVHELLYPLSELAPLENVPAMMFEVEINPSSAVAWTVSA